MKKPIAWYEENLANANRYLAELEATLARQAADVERHRASVAFRQHQIDEAKRRGLSDFDGERFLTKRSA